MSHANKTVNHVVLRLHGIWSECKWPITGHKTGVTYQSLSTSYLVVVLEIDKFKQENTIKRPLNIAFFFVDGRFTFLQMVSKKLIKFSKLSIYMYFICLYSVYFNIKTFVFKNSLAFCFFLYIQLTLYQ